MENQQPMQSNDQLIEIRPKTHRVRKLLILLVVIIGLAGIFYINIPRIMSLFTRDIAPIDDSDLMLQKVFLKESENGYYDLINLKEKIYFPKEKNALISEISEGKKWDEVFVEELLIKNTDALKYFSEASKKTNIQNPPMSDPKNINFNMVFPNLNDWRNMSKISSIRAIYLAKQGKSKEAMGEALVSLNVGQAIQNSQITLMEYLVSLAIKNTSLKTIQQILNYTNLSRGESVEYIKKLNPYQDYKRGLITAFRAEYIVQASLLDINMIKDALEGNKLLASKINKSYYFQPNKTQLLFADNARRQLEEVSGSCGQTYSVPTKLVPNINPVNVLFTDNAIGKILLDMTATNLASVGIRKCEGEILVGVTQVMLAIKGYKADTNKYPTNLIDLVPDYLESIPQDLFSESDLKYSPHEKRIYSTHASSTYMFSF